MSDFEFNIGPRKRDKAPFMVIYGPAGTGKTSFAHHAPGNVFIQTEDGAGELVLNTMKDDTFQTYDEIMAALRYIYANPEGIRVVAIDTIDHLEPIVWKHVCAINNWDSIETPGYGKGYIECDAAWMKLINALVMLRDKHNIAIVALAHEIVRQVNDPQNGPYDAHELKLHKRAVALWKEKADMIGLLKNAVVVDQKTGKGKGGTTPTLYVRPNAAYTAKTRYKSMPSMIQIREDTGWADVAKHIPFFQEDEKDS